MSVQETSLFFFFAIRRGESLDSCAHDRVLLFAHIIFKDDVYVAPLEL